MKTKQTVLKTIFLSFSFRMCLQGLIFNLCQVDVKDNIFFIKCQQLICARTKFVLAYLL